MAESQRISIYASTEDRLVFRGARLLRTGPTIPRDRQNYWTVDVGIARQDVDQVDYFGPGYNGAETDLLVNSSESLTGPTLLDEPLPAGTQVVALLTRVGSPPPFTEASIQVVRGWQNTI